MESFSLYVHIPFCAHKCPYCDFNTYAVPKPPEVEYVEAVCKEIAAASSQDRWSNKTLKTIFFGGGTPSFFSAVSIKKIIDTAKSSFSGNSLGEVSLEANPEHINSQYLGELLLAGVNRLSVGVQSLQDNLLVKLGRNHDSNKAISGVIAAASAGFKNISLDLMYGTPGQSLDGFRADMEKAISLPINHISIYGLTIEPGTPYYVSHSKGDLVVPNEDETSLMYDEMVNFLKQNNFNRYEVSNFAKNLDAQSKHNKNYWEHGECLGVGAGAHSFCRSSEHPLGVRWSNEARPEKYIGSIADKKNAIAWSETLTKEQALFETFYVGLRMIEGIPLERATKNSGGIDPLNFYEEELQRLVAEGLILIQSGKVSSTVAGIKLLDSLLASLAINSN